MKNHDRSRLPAGESVTLDTDFLPVVIQYCAEFGLIPKYIPMQIQKTWTDQQINKSAYELSRPRY